MKQWKKTVQSRVEQPLTSLETHPTFNDNTKSTLRHYGKEIKLEKLCLRAS